MRVAGCEEDGACFDKLSMTSKCNPETIEGRTSTFSRLFGLPRVSGCRQKGAVNPIFIANADL
jgi:hypothetical protein